jgi:predicted DCC family thiol-disulfide oxidoreductase YuxK
LQSETGIKLCKQHDINTVEIDSIVLIKNEIVYIKSSAILEVIKDLSIGWRVFRIGIIVPKGIRDWMYDVVAKYRYKIFGKKNNLPIHSEDLTDRFL